MIDFLYTNIGRGHPHYLDGILECLPPDRIGRVADVFSASDGVSRLAWSAVQRAYRSAGWGWIVASLYSRLRAGTDYNRRGLMQSLMGRRLSWPFPDETNSLVVAHPLLVALLQSGRNLVYQHGEVVAPLESLVHGPHRILVPLTYTADTFLEAGFSEEQLFVSGLCVEPGLVSQAKSARDDRVCRLADAGSLCGAFYSSDAEPGIHARSIVGAALSAVNSGGRVLMFAQRSSTLEKHVRKMFSASGSELVEVVDFSGQGAEGAGGHLCLYDDRRHLNEMTAELFPLFDYFVAPSHERTNWALGLGLPMFVVDPPLGSYAPLNRDLLLEHGVADIIGDHQAAVRFGENLGRLQETGALRQMSDSGWHRYDIDGFANIVGMLAGL